MKIITVDDDDVRLDRYLRRLLPNIKQSVIEKSLRLGLIRLDGAKAAANSKVQIGQGIHIKNFDILDSQAVPLEKPRFIYDPKLVEIICNNILYEDDDLIAINKPAGLAVQGGNKVKISIDDVLDQVRPGEILKIAHRLDKETSGVLLLAKNVRCARVLMQSFQDHKINKHYLAMTEKSPLQNSIKITQAIAKLRISGEEKMVVNNELGKSATTKLSVLQRYSNGMALLELSPLSGRKHQIRVHLAYIHCPVVGDKKYGSNSAKWDSTKCDGAEWDSSKSGGRNMNVLQLHAHKICLVTPAGLQVEIIAPIPTAMQDLMDTLTAKESIGDSF